MSTSEDEIVVHKTPKKSSIHQRSVSFETFTPLSQSRLARSGTDSETEEEESSSSTSEIDEIVRIQKRRKKEKKSKKKSKKSEEDLEDPREKPSETARERQWRSQIELAEKTEEGREILDHEFLGYYHHLEREEDVLTDEDDEEIRACGGYAPVTVDLFLRQGIVYLYLVLLGGLTAALGFTMDLAIAGLRMGHNMLIALTPNFGLAYVLWLAYAASVMYLAVKFTEKVSVRAKGSGIPEVRVILNGVKTFFSFLSFSTLIAKVIGLSLAIGSGLWIGKEGPYIHLSSIIAWQLFRFFPVINNNYDLKIQLLGAAAATGVASNFGTILGGVLFSIEVTSTYYPVRNYWFSAVSCMVGGFIFRFLYNTFEEEQPLFSSLIRTNYPFDIDFSALDVACFTFFGVSMGLLSVAFVWVTTHAILIKRRLAKHSLDKPWYDSPVERVLHYWARPLPYSLTLMILVSIFTFPRLLGTWMALGSFPVLQDLVNSDSFTTIRPDVPFNSAQWTDGSLLFNLLTFSLLRLALTPLTITVETPAGLFVPVVLIGAGWGRFWGELLIDRGFDIVPGGYSLVAAAAMIGGVTQTYSTTVIMLELTGQLTHALPVILGVTLSIAISRALSLNIFSAIAKAKDFPFLDELKYWKYHLLTKRIMRRSFVYFTRTMNLHDIEHLLKLAPHSSFPVVEAKGDMTFLGEVNRGYLNRFLRAHGKHHKKRDEVKIKIPWYIRLFQSIKASAIASSLYNMFVTDAHLEEKKHIQIELEEQQCATSDVNIQFVDAPVLLHENTKLYHVHLHFITLNAGRLFVVENGKLLGIVSRATLRRALKIW